MIESCHVVLKSRMHKRWFGNGREVEKFPRNNSYIYEILNCAVTMRYTLYLRIPFK